MHTVPHRRRPRRSASWRGAVAFVLLGLAGCDDADSASPAPDAARTDGQAADARAADAGPTDAGMRDAALDAAPLDATADASPPDAAPHDAVPPLPERGPDPDPALRFNHLQARGTHNSYHRLPDPVLHPTHRYHHAPLAIQLGDQGVRQLELDIHARPDGGFDVLHLPFIDPETSCLDFGACLDEVLAWSVAHPDHVPIMIWIEPKDEGAGAASGYVPSEGRMLALDATIRAAIPAERLITPDEIRGDAPTLPAALAARGWPSLHQVRGRLIFALLDSGDRRTEYLDGAPNLAGRVMFADADGPEDPWAATLKLDNPRDPVVQARVSEGFLVTGNVDSAGGTPEENAAERAAGLAAGIHYLASDHPAPDAPGDTDWLDIPGGTPARCNPQTAPADCTPAAIEALP